MREVEIYEPVRLCMGVISAPCEIAREAMRMHLEFIRNRPFRSALGQINWREFFLSNGQFYDIMRAEIALFSPEENVTIYVCNLADGWSSLYGNLVNANGFDAFLFRTTFPDAARYKVFEMDVWQRGVLTRQVRALQEEDGWGFLNKGNPLPFEEVERYKKREIRERLDRKLIERYSETTGFSTSSVTRFDGQCWRFWRVD